MKTMTEEQAPVGIAEQFLEEYSAEAAVRKYTKATAGQGISYLLENDYRQIYVDALAKSCIRSAGPKGARVLEFGCGGGMNLVHLMSVLEREGIAVERAYGTDFSTKLITAANQEAQKYLSPRQREKVQFCAARNEDLADDMAVGLGVHQNELLGSFHFILGVNTFRYCQRLQKEVDCATGIYNLLAPGGVCVVIDMNHGFPFFRSRFRDQMTKEKEAYYLPTLEEYAHPFSVAGFETLRKENFCWIPHSAGPALTKVLRALTPALNAMVPSHAMRSLVVSRKPGRK